MGIDGYPLRIVLVSCRSSAISMIYNFAPSATDPRDVILPPTSTASPPPSLSLPSYILRQRFPLTRDERNVVSNGHGYGSGPLLTYRLLPISYTRNIANRKRLAHRGTRSARVLSSRRRDGAQNCICIRGRLSRSTCKRPRSSLPSRGASRERKGFVGARNQKGILILSEEIRWI